MNSEQIQHNPADAAAAGRPLRVALDLRFLNKSGIGSYLSGLLHGFAQIGVDIEWTFIGPEAETPAGLRVARWEPFPAPMYSAGETFSYPRLAGADVFHFPHYCLPVARARARVVTIHDLFHLRYGSPMKRLYQRLFLQRLKWSGAEVIAVSEKTRDDLLYETTISGARIFVVPSGPGRPVATPERPRPRPLKVDGGMMIEPPWIAAVGIDQPHKNMEFLLASMGLWYPSRSAAPPLVWMGPSREQARAHIEKIPTQSRPKIHILPYGSEAELEALYAGAAALVFPSLDEGFGFPPLEAMARGVPVLAARRRPMLEHLGRAALWFDADDSASLWRALDSLVADEALRTELADLGYAQAEKFSWSSAARLTYAVYRKAAAAGS